MEKTKVQIKSVYSEHCSFCKRRFGDGEITFIGPIKGGALKAACFCCMGILETVQIVDYVAPASIAQAVKVHQLLFGGNSEPLNFNEAHQTFSLSAMIPVKSPVGFSKNCGQLTTAEIIETAVKIPQENWPEEVKIVAEEARRFKHVMGMYQWPDGVCVFLGTHGAPSDARIIESYRKAALQRLKAGRPQ